LGRRPPTTTAFSLGSSRSRLRPAMLISSCGRWSLCAAHGLIEATIARSGSSAAVEFSLSATILSAGGHFRFVVRGERPSVVAATAKISGANATLRCPPGSRVVHVAAAAYDDSGGCAAAGAIAVVERLCLLHELRGPRRRLGVRSGRDQVRRRPPKRDQSARGHGRVRCSLTCSNTVFCPRRHACRRPADLPQSIATPAHGVRSPSSPAHARG
jgi:hypothetical protein